MSRIALAHKLVTIPIELSHPESRTARPRAVYCVCHLASRLTLMAIILLFQCLPAIQTLAQMIPPGTGRFGVSSKQGSEKATAQKNAVKTQKTAARTANVATPEPAAGPVQVSSLAGFTSTANSASPAKTLTLTNTSGTDTYALALTGLTGPNLADFNITSPCATPILKPGNSCDVTITFQPSAPGTSSATLGLTATDTTVAGTLNLSVPLTGTATAKCQQPTEWFLPLSRKGVSDDTINCYFNTSSNLAFVTEAQYLYNPGSSANAISGNLASLQFPGGFQLTLAGNANTASCASANSSTGGTPATPTSSSSCGTSASSTSTPSLQQDEQTLTQGGTFALKALWPLVNVQEPKIQLLSMVAPKMGFDISGLSAQGTATGATDVNGNLSSETYFQLDAIPAKSDSDSPGAIFADYRFGWEHVSSTFASSAGLTGGNNFALQQLSGGLVINGFLRISAQRYFGPEQAYVSSSGSTVKVNNFNNWQLVVQLVPANVKAKN